MAKKKSDIEAINKGFLQYLEKNGHIAKLPEIARTHVQLSRTIFDPNVAFVTSVVKLTEEEKTVLKKKLQTVFHRPIFIKNKLDPKLIAGMKIRVADEVIDLSLKTQLSALREELAQ